MRRERGVRGSSGGKRGEGGPAGILGAKRASFRRCLILYVVPEILLLLVVNYVSLDCNRGPHN